jgi:hypothetical protein
LQAIRSRVDLLGGKMDIKSQPGKGTVVLIRLPMNPGPEGGERFLFSGEERAGAAG